MSVSIMSHIWKNSPQKGNALLVLLAIADSANDEGKCYPGVGRIAKKVRMTERAVQTIIRKLERDGELQVEINAGTKTKRGFTNLYTIILADEGVNADSPHKAQGVNADSPHKAQGVNADSPHKAQGVNADSPESSVNESSVKEESPDSFSPVGESAIKPSAKIVVLKDHTADIGNLVPATEPPQQTSVVNFQDVKGHWSKDTQSWDDPDYVYIGRANNHYGLPESEWHNPYPLAKGASPEERTEVVSKYKILLFKRLRDNPAEIERLLQLRGKKLVCWCSPEECHGDVLVSAITYYSSQQNNRSSDIRSTVSENTPVIAANSGKNTPDTPDAIEDSPKPAKVPESRKKAQKPIDYDHAALLQEIQQTFEVSGGIDLRILTLLRGTAKKGEWKAFRLAAERVMDANSLKRWANWYRGKYPNLGLPEKAETISKHINRWWDAGCPVTLNHQQMGHQPDRLYNADDPVYDSSRFAEVTEEMVAAMMESIR